MARSVRKTPIIQNCTHGRGDRAAWKARVNRRTRGAARRVLHDGGDRDDIAPPLEADDRDGPGDGRRWMDRAEFARVAEDGPRRLRKIMGK